MKVPVAGMGRGPLCCCCMANNVRHMVLVLTSVCISVLFTNLILFNLTAVLDPELSTELRPVPSLDSLHEYTIWHGEFRLFRIRFTFSLHFFLKVYEPILIEIDHKLPFSDRRKRSINETDDPKLSFSVHAPIWVIFVKFSLNFECCSGFLALFPLRLLIGVSFAPALPVAGAICASWGCLNEQLLFIGTVFAFIHVSSNARPSMLIIWPSRIQSKLGKLFRKNKNNVSLLFRFAIFHRDRPQHHPWVNGLELNRIVAGKVQELKSNRAQDGACPTLMRSLAAWSLWIAAFSLFFAIAVVVTYMPSTLSCQEIFMVDYLGGYSVLPFILIVSFSVSTIDLSSSAFYGIVPTVYFLMLLLAPLGLCVSGLLRSLCLVGRVYTQHITAFIAVSFAVAFITAPLLIFAILRTNSLAEWSRVFMLSAAVIAISSVVFAIFGRGRASNWAAASWDPLMSTKMRNLQPIDFSQDECGLYELRLIDPNKK
ncbi:unnamed protein product [Haemonchus placei]|uniref:RGS domain-containing protein n=1 Tax=Haemonchus placei TaxID=6290 RepID=A0A0N4WW77_HAEPC|nr:unnamed protein product [Haemonchus placei]